MRGGGKAGALLYEGLKLGMHLIQDGDTVVAGIDGRSSTCIDTRPTSLPRSCTSNSCWLVNRHLLSLSLCQRLEARNVPGKLVKNCCLCWGFCLFWYLMVFFVLYYFVKVQDMIEEEDDFAPAPEEDLFGLGGYGYGDE